MTAPAGSFVAALSARYAGLTTAEMLRVGIGTDFKGRIALVSSFGTEAAVLLHLVAEVHRATPVLFLDTGKLFGETLRYRDLLVARLGLTDVRSLAPVAAELRTRDPGEDLWQRDPDACCDVRKVRPLAAALQPFDAWINGRKRFQGGTRAALDLVESADNKVKLNPLADWSAADIAAYFAAHDLPRHPLEAEGYRSIGCFTCTDRVKPGEDARAGRWRGTAKTECGIHPGTGREIGA